MAPSLPPPPTGQTIADLDIKRDKDQKVTDVVSRTNWTWADWLQRFQQSFNQLIPAGGAQSAIQFQDEGSNLGTSGTVTLFNVVGPDLVATRVGNDITLTHTNPTVVSSIAGTANQITASSPTGNVTLSLAGPHNYTTLTSHGLLYGNGTSAIQALAEASNGQLPIGSTGAAPVLATLTAGSGISVTNGAGSITIAATGSSSADSFEAALVY